MSELFSYNRHFIVSVLSVYIGWPMDLYGIPAWMTWPDVHRKPGDKPIRIYMYITLNHSIAVKHWPNVTLNLIGQFVSPLIQPEYMIYWCFNIERGEGDLEFCKLKPSTGVCL